LTYEDENIGGGDQGIPSLIDTWVSLGALEADGERNRGLYVLKSRGMDHSNQIREYQITKNGIQLLDVYRSVGGVLVGSARRHAQATQREKRDGNGTKGAMSAKQKPILKGQGRTRPQGKSS
jgi:circadian clock protein KaiC